MNDIEVVERAQNYLKARCIEFVNSPEIGRQLEEKVEVVFPLAEMLDPTVACIDPSDVRVWVYLNSEQVSLVEQM